MDESLHSHHRHEGPHESVHHGNRPYWKRAHQDWRAWVGVFLMLAAMVIYIMSYDLAWVPRMHRQVPASDVAK